jgi:hypothetical protein
MAIASGQLGDLFDRQEPKIRFKILLSECKNFELILAVLKSGRLALVRENAVQEGDSAAILHGLDVPCVLRKAEGENE